MKVLGLCGGSGSGKGLAASYFNNLGVKIIDTDRVYHQLVSSDTPCLKAITDEFGISVLKDGVLDRKKLGEIVFADETKRLRLNEIAHFHILNTVRTMIAEYNRRGCLGVIVDAPLLFESGFDKECDETLCIIAPEEERITRIVKRDKIDKSTAKKRIDSQKSNDWLITHCDYFITNDGSCEKLEQNVYKLAKTVFDI